MASTTAKKKMTARKKTAARKKVSAKKVRSRKKREPSLEEVEYSMEKMALSDFAESTKEELKKLGDKIHEATDRGVSVVKEIADEVQRFAKDKTELTRLKIDLHNLRAEREKLYTLMGEQLVNLYKAKKLSNLKTRLKADFARYDELQSFIDEKEKLAAKLSVHAQQ